MEQNVHEEMEIDLREIFQLLMSRVWIILLVGLIFAGTTGVVCKFLVTPLYRSTTQLCITGSKTTLSSLADLQIGSQLTQDYIVVTKSRPVLEQVIKNLELDMEHDELLGVTTVTNPTDTRILEISVTDPDPYMAKQIVDQYAEVSKKRIAEVMDIPEPRIVAEGYADDDKVSPTTGKNTVIAAFLGVFLACAVIIVRYILDDTIQSSDDIEKYLGLNTLGILPLEETALQEEDRERREKKRRKRESRKRKKEGAGK